MALTMALPAPGGACARPCIREIHQGAPSNWRCEAPPDISRALNPDNIQGEVTVTRGVDDIIEGTLVHALRSHRSRLWARPPSSRPRRRSRSLTGYTRAVCLITEALTEFARAALDSVLRSLAEYEKAARRTRVFVQTVNLFHYTPSQGVSIWPEARTASGSGHKQLTPVSRPGQNARVVFCHENQVLQVILADAGLEVAWFDADAHAGLERGSLSRADQGEFVGTDSQAVPDMGP